MARLGAPSGGAGWVATGRIVVAASSKGAMLLRPCSSIAALTIALGLLGCRPAPTCVFSEPPDTPADAAVSADGPPRADAALDLGRGPADADAPDADAAAPDADAAAPDAAPGDARADSTAPVFAPCTKPPCMNVYNNCPIPLWTHAVGTVPLDDGNGAASTRARSTSTPRSPRSAAAASTPTTRSPRASRTACAWSATTTNSSR